MSARFLTYVFCLCFFCAFSQERYNADAASWIDNKEGLKQNAIKVCVADKNGMIWMATEMGLYRYDGKILKEIQDKRYPDINKKRINLTKDSKTGDITFTVFPGYEIYTIHNNKIAQLYANKYNFKRRLLFSTSQLYYSTDDSLINKAFVYKKSQIFLSRMRENKGSLYVPSFDTLFVFKKGVKTQKINYKGTVFTTLMVFGSKVVVVDSKKINLLAADNKSMSEIETDAILHDYIATTFANTSSNSNNKNILVSDNNYYFHYKGNVYQIRYVKNKLVSEFLFKHQSDEIGSICYLKKDDIFFIGTITKGLGIIKPKSFNTLTFDESLYNSTYSVVQSGKNTWASASGWTYDKTAGKATLYTPLKGLNVWFLLSYNGTFYFQEGYNLIDVNNHKNRNPFQLKDFEGNYNSFCYLNQSLWISNSLGLFSKINNEIVRDTFFDTYLESNEIQKITAYKNKLLIATSKGVFIYDPQKKQAEVIKGLEKVYARNITFLNSNDFWVGCYGNGLFLVYEGKVYKVADENIDITSAHAIEEDKKGNLWISTNDGLFCVNKKQALEKIIHHKKINIYKYTIDDGLLTNEFNGGAIYCSLKDSTGILGFPCMKGFVWFRPELIPKHVYKGKIIINAVKADLAEITPKNNTYCIPDDANIIHFDFSYPYYFNRENLTVEYRFSYEKEWKKVEGNSIHFARPKDGLFQILLRIHTHGFEHSNDVVQGFNLDFEPKYYETIGFIIFLGLGVLILIYTSIQIGLQMNRNREKALQKKIDEKTIALQETLSDLVVSKKEVEKSLTEKNVLLKEIHHRVKNNLQMVITLLSYQSSRFDNKELNDFLERGTARIVSMALIHERLYQTDNLGHIDFREYADNLVKNIIASMADEGDIQFSLDTDDATFDVRRAIPLGLILNELVVNTIKHNYQPGKKLSFSISLKEADSHYTITYNDPQSTMTQEDIKKSSFGLGLIQLLAAQLKGKSKLSFTDGFTAEIEF